MTDNWSLATFNYRNERQTEVASDQHHTEEEGIETPSTGSRRGSRGIPNALLDECRDEKEKELGAFATTVYEDAFPVHIRAALKALSDDGYMYSYNYGFFGVDTLLGSHHIDFGNKTFPLPNKGEKNLSLKVFNEYTAIQKRQDARVEKVETLIRELNGVLLSAKTRPELAVLWPGVRKLMGDKWVDAESEASTLPVVITTNLDKALESMKLAA